MKRIQWISVVLALMVCLLAMPAAEAETDAKALLKSIDLLARQGWILNCGYKVQGDTVDEVTDNPVIAPLSQVPLYKYKGSPTLGVWDVMSTDVRIEIK